MDMIKLSLIVAMLGLSACATFDRDSRSGYSPVSGDASVSDFYQERGNRDESDAREELGYNNRVLTDVERAKLEDRLHLRHLESNLTSKRDRKQYYSVRSMMRGDHERINFLDLPNYEAKQKWLQTRGFLKEEETYSDGVAKTIEANDIALGMSHKAVRESWGDPDAVETAGDPLYGYERWNFHRFVAGNDGYQKELRVVYFEGGRVVGWETPN
jgi:hypothetical protein